MRGEWLAKYTAHLTRVNFQLNFSDNWDDLQKMMDQTMKNTRYQHITHLIRFSKKGGR